MTNTSHTISLAEARDVLERAEAKATELGVPVSIAVVDPGGNLKALSRQDGASFGTLQMAIDKATTSAGSGMTTAAFFDFVNTDDALRLNVVPRAGMCLLAGGAPVIVDGAIVGAVGISGGHYTQDEVIANAATAS